jgi:predicted RNA-binding protein with TRAM domain
MKIIIKTLQGKQLPVEVEETFTVSIEVIGSEGLKSDVILILW